MIYKLLSKIPLFGSILKVVNTYAFNGDHKADKEFAPLWLWVKSFWIQILLSTFLTLLSSNHLIYFLSEFFSGFFNLPFVSASAVPSDLIFASFPSLLGFGIGVYALIFALSTTLVNNIETALKNAIEQGRRKNGSVLMLNSELSFPLLVLVLAIGVAAIAKLYPHTSIIQDLTWFAFWFSLIAIIELVTTLFSLGENELLLKVSTEKKADDKAM